MLANCALGSFVAYNLGGCSVSGQCDLDQSRSTVRKPRAASGASQDAWVCDLQGHPMTGDGC